MRRALVALAASALTGAAAGYADPPQPALTLNGCRGILVRNDIGTRYDGIVVGGPIVIADTNDLFANAVDGQLECYLVDGARRSGWGNSNWQSYAVGYAWPVAEELGPTDGWTVCGTLHLRNAYGEEASFDVGCTSPVIIEGLGQACGASQFLPQPVRPIVEQPLGC
jgi:hypothetical protein